VPDVPNFQERMCKAAQISSNLNENFFIMVKKFCGSRIAVYGEVG
jgi:hypothetical protein